MATPAASCPQLGSVAPRAVVNIGLSGTAVAFCSSISQWMGKICSHVAPAGQQSAVVLAASGTQSVVFGQQKLEGRPWPQARKFDAGQEGGRGTAFLWWDILDHIKWYFGREGARRKGREKEKPRRDHDGRTPSRKLGMHRKDIWHWPYSEYPGYW